MSEETAAPEKTAEPTPEKPLDKEAQIKAYFAADSKERRKLVEKYPFLKQTFSEANHP